MPELTADKRERLRLHAEQILEVHRLNPQWHWTRKQTLNYATWMVEVLNALETSERLQRDTEAAQRERDAKFCESLGIHKVADAIRRGGEER